MNESKTRDYAVIAAGGKQYNVSDGQEIEVELIRDGEVGDKVKFPVVFASTDGKIVGAKKDLENAFAEAEILEYVKAKKIHGFTYKNKSRISKRWGHRQKYHLVKITSIKS
jgi:large subunit ribosomal protein L21